MRAALDTVVEQENWKQAAVAANNLSELEMTQGAVGEAIRDSERAVAHADRSDDEFQAVARRTTDADALHQAGQRAEAEARFGEAEAMQAESPRQHPLLSRCAAFNIAICCWARRSALPGGAYSWGRSGGRISNPTPRRPRNVTPTCKDLFSIALLIPST